jgi:hypothetical protein
MLFFEKTKLKKSYQQFLETTNKFGRLKICVPDISADDRNPTKTFFNSKHFLKEERDKLDETEGLDF